MRKLPRLLFVLMLLSIISACDKTGVDHKDLKYSKGSGTDTTALRVLIDSTISCYETSRLSATLAYGREACALAIELGDTMSWCDALSYEQSAYERLGMTDSSLAIAKQLLAVDEADGDPEMLSHDYNNLAFIYTSNKDFERAKEFVDKSIAYERQTAEQQALAIRYGLACEIYNKIGKADSALSFGKEAYSLDSLAGHAMGMARRLAQMADAYDALGQNANAERCYRRAIADFDSLHEPHSLAITCRLLGEFSLKHGSTEEAITLLERALRVGQEIGDLKVQADACQALSEACASLDEAKEKLYLHEYTQLHDSMVNVEKSRALTEFKVRYDSQTKDARLQEQEVALHSWHNYVEWLIALVFALICIILAWRYFAARREQMLSERVVQLETNIAELKQQFLKQIDDEEQKEGQKKQISAEDLLFLQRVNALISEQMDKADLSAEAIASRLCITSQQLRRKLDALTGKTASSYISDLRLEFAKTLLKNEQNMSIAEVARRCGFEEPGNFTRAFKNKSGISPSQYKLSEKV